MNYHRLEMLISYFEAYKKADIHDRETAVNQKVAEIQIEREKKFTMSINDVFNINVFICIGVAIVLITLY